MACYIVEYLCCELINTGSRFLDMMLIYLPKDRFGLFSNLH